MKSRPIVLLVEDDRETRNVLLVALRSRGYDVAVASTAAQALARVRTAPPSVMILSLSVQDADGVDVIAAVRREGEFPILALSARRDEALQIRALDAGANDYVTKPVQEGELLARVRAALRVAPRLSRDVPREYRELELGDIRMDAVGRRAFLKNTEVELTPTEFKLLYILLSEAGRVVTHGQLLSEVWGPRCRNEVQYIRVYMRHLRLKIEENPAEPKRILTAAGVGYRVAP